MKPATALAAAATVLAAAALAACSPTSPATPATATATASSTGTSFPVEDIETVQSVHDGDTFRLTDGRSVRLLGIDTPEVPPTSVPAQCYGLKARDLVRQILPAGTQVSLYTDPKQGPTDRYNRLLRYVEIPSLEIQDLSAYLLEAGAAQVFTQYPVARTPHYSQLQEDAQTHRRGLWGVC